MNEEMLSGEGRDIKGKLKETVGDVTSDHALQGEGLIDQMGGKIEKLVGAARDSLPADAAPLVDKARRFAREQPLAAALVAGAFGLAFLNLLRGKR